MDNLCLDGYIVEPVGFGDDNLPDMILKEPVRIINFVPITQLTEDGPYGKYPVQIMNAIFIRSNGSLGSLPLHCLIVRPHEEEHKPQLKDDNIRD